MTNCYRFTLSDQQLIAPDSGYPRWSALYAAYCHYFQQQSETSWLLFDSDCFYFSALLMALLSTNKQVVMPQNGQPAHLAEIAQLGHRLVNARELAAELQLQEPAEQPLQLVLPLNGQISLFTSGSSGQPKRIDKQLQQLLIEVDVLEKTFAPAVDSTVFLSTVSHQHVYGLLFKVLWPLTQNKPLVCKSFEYPEHVRHYAQQHPDQQLTLLSSPAHLHRLAEDNVLRPIEAQLAMMFSSGGPLQADKNLQLQSELHCPMTEVYGSTETGGIAWRQLQADGRTPWTPFAVIEVQQQQHQQLAIRSPYLNDTNEWYLTDDRVELHDNQQFTLLGRVDRVIKLEEKRLSLDEVQQKLLTHPWVNDCHVLIVGEETKKLAAVVILNQQGKLQLNENKLAVNRALKSYLSSWFEAVLLPKKFRYLTALPCNAQGKLNKQQIEALFV